MEHHLQLSSKCLHGVWSRAIPPVLAVESGDAVRLSTLDAWWGREPFLAPFGDRARVDHPDAERGHALTGPIAVKDAQPGDVIEIEFLKLVPATHGFTVCGGYPSPHYTPFAADAGGPAMLIWHIDPATGRATTDIAGNRIQVPVLPFLGVVGLAPAAPGEHSTTPPRRTGGNLDCCLLTQGTTLFLPVEVPGALLSVGDGHAAQGDGEVSNNGIECAMTEIVLKLTVRKDLQLITPVALTPGGWVTLGLGDTLDAAAKMAADAMLDLIQGKLQCSRPQALGIASVCVDLHITQIVNGVKGVHAVWRA